MTDIFLPDSVYRIVFDCYCGKRHDAKLYDTVECECDQTWHVGGVVKIWKADPDEVDLSKYQTGGQK